MSLFATMAVPDDLVFDDSAGPEALALVSRYLAAAPARMKTGAFSVHVSNIGIITSWGDAKGDTFATISIAPGRFINFRLKTDAPSPQLTGLKANVSVEIVLGDALVTPDGLATDKPALRTLCEDGIGFALQLLDHALDPKNALTAHQRAIHNQRLAALAAAFSTPADSDHYALAVGRGLADEDQVRLVPRTSIDPGFREKLMTPAQALAWAVPGPRVLNITDSGLHPTTPTISIRSVTSAHPVNASVLETLRLLSSLPEID